MFFVLLSTYLQHKLLELGFLGWKINFHVIFLDLTKLFPRFNFHYQLECIRMPVYPRFCQQSIFFIFFNFANIMDISM